LKKKTEGQKHLSQMEIFPTYFCRGQEGSLFFFLVCLREQQKGLTGAI
jgi:hypothetical protein